MDDNKHCEECCGHCCGMGHMHGMGGKYHLLRWLLGVAIIIIVFWMGFKLGEFKGYFANSDGYYGRGFGHGMMYFGADNTDYFPARQYRNQNLEYQPMMWQLPSTTTPAK